MDSTQMTNDQNETAINRHQNQVAYYFRQQKIAASEHACSLSRIDS